MRNDERGMKTAGSVQRSGVLPFIIHHSSFIIAFVLGVLAVVGFAPFYMYPLPVVTLAGLFYLCSQATTPRAAAAAGFSYGLGFFLCGVSWIYVSLHDFGMMPAPVAALVTFLFCAFLALFPAAVAYGSARAALPDAARWGALYNELVPNYRAASESYQRAQEAVKK